MIITLLVTFAKFMAVKFMAINFAVSNLCAERDKYKEDYSNDDLLALCCFQGAYSGA